MGARRRAYKMPNFEGFLYEDVLVLAEQSRIALGPIETKFDTRRLHRVVLEQKPPPGYQITAGEKVTLVVNQSSSDATQGDMQGFVSKGFFRYRIENGFLRKHLHVAIIGQAFSIDLVDSFVDPGEEIWLLVPDIAKSRVVLLEDQRPVFPGWKKSWPKLFDWSFLDNE